MAAQCLTHNMPTADLAPALDGGMAKDDPFSLREIDR
jgi:hypothetical protein